MSLFHQHLWDWALLVTFLSLLAYAAYAIRNEKDLYLERAQPFDFSPVNLNLPHWWSQVSPPQPQVATPRKITFHRSDTKYDWNASFEWVSSSLEPQELGAAILEKKNIVPDLDTEFQNPRDILKKLGANSPLIKDSMNLKGVRIEGTGTCHGEDRIYFDLFILSHHNPHSENKCLVCYSQSSILNGCVEGPYFEEVINRIQFTETMTTKPA